MDSLTPTGKSDCERYISCSHAREKQSFLKLLYCMSPAVNIHRKKWLLRWEIITVSNSGNISQSSPSSTEDYTEKIDIVCFMNNVQH